MCSSDLVLDEYLWGSVDRVSPEAPVPVVHVQDESVVLGVGADPEPGDASWSVDAEYAVVEADASRPDLTDALEMKRWVLRV